MQKYKTEYWSVNVPTLWGAEHADGSDILYDKAGVGELVFSTIFQTDGITDEQLEELASEHIDADAVFEDVNPGDFSGFAVSYLKGEEYWSEWFLRTDNCLLFISYNCDEGNEEVDEDVVESILESLEEVSK